MFFIFLRISSLLRRISVLISGWIFKNIVFFENEICLLLIMILVVFIIISPIRSFFAFSVLERFLNRERRSMIGIIKMASIS